MKNFIIYMLMISSTVFGGMALTNYLVDPGHVYSNDYVDKVVEGARKGLNVEGVTNLDERLYKLKFAEVYRDREFDYLALGSSRIMTVSEDALNGATLLNLGVSGCKIEDMIAFYQICKDNNIRYNHVLIAADPTFFNANDNDSRWKTIEKYFNEYQNLPLEVEESKHISNLFSVSYFKSAILAIPSLLQGKEELKYVKTFVNEGSTKRTDGSIYYDLKYRNTPQEQIDKEAITWKHGSYNNFNNVSQERIDLFEKMIASFKADGVEVIFFYCPFHPTFFKKAFEMKGVVEAARYVDDYARRNKIRIIGSFNAEDIGFKNTDFYDAHHARKESLDKLLKNKL